MSHWRIFTQKRIYLLVIFSWIFFAILCLLYLPHSGQPFKIGDISDPHSESTLAHDLIKEKFPFNRTSFVVLYQNNKLTTDHPYFKSYINESVRDLKNLPFKNRVTSPYENRKQISSNKHTAYTVIDTELPAERIATSINHIKNALHSSSDIKLLLGGEPAYIADVNKLSEENLIKGELIALPICFVIMIFIFGGFTAALITILCGVISIIIITTILYILGHYIDLSIYVLNIASMLGLGLCLDYTLLITYRFKEEWACYNECKPTIRITLANSGKAIVFSGIIVLICMGSLIFFPSNIIHSMGIAGIIIVSTTMLCCLTFLPAMLCIFEKYITKNVSPVLDDSPESSKDTWYKLAIFVMKFPILFLISTIIILLFLGYPVLDIKLNNSDAKILPTWVESRKMVDQFDKYFDSNELEPITIVLTAKNKSILTDNNISAIYDFVKKLKKDPRVERVASIVSIKPNLTKKQYQQLYQSSQLPFNTYEKKLFKNSTQGKYTIISVISKYSKDDKRNFELVNTIRSMEIDNHINKLVTGFTARTIDAIQSSYRLFLEIFIFITLVTYLLLVWLLRSIVLPLKAIVMNLLSLSVCYGMLVFIFQEGHFSNLLKFQAVGFTDLNLPIIIFFILFGLSMDYEIFLLTRIQEYYNKTSNNAKSVALGVAKSARIISSAAIILIVVTSAFVTADLIFIKAFGLGTALAIIVDTTLIRLLLVPATMNLLGDWNWYIPKWLDKLLPNINFEEERSCNIPKSQQSKRGA